VLQVISSFAGELDPVFQAILANATRICEAKFGVMQFLERDGFRAVAFHDVPPAYGEAMRRDPVFHPKVGHPLRRVVETKQVVHAADARTEEKMRGRIVELAGARTLLLVPMLKDEVVLGVICIYRQEVRPFTDRQIELVQNFAAQAVIAIENARLLNELRQRTGELSQRTADLTEALERQTATSEVLQVVSRSAGDLEPVFASMLENAVRLCDAKFGIMNFPERGGIRPVATHNVPEAFAEFIRGDPVVHFGPKHPLARAAATKQVLHIPDLELYADEDAVIAKFRQLTGARTVLHVPMLKDEQLAGIVSIYRQQVRPFAEKQIDLVKSFAAQAVIAIENARLLNELRQRTADLTEALEQQTATSEVLKVVSSSPSELQPVFEAMLDNATRICQAPMGTMVLYENGGFRHVALHGAPAAYAECAREPIVIPKPAQGLGRLLRTKQVVHIADIFSEPDRGTWRTGRTCWRSHATYRSNAQRTGTGRFFGHLPPGNEALHWQANCAGAELCRSSRHRHRKCAAAQRTSSAHCRLTDHTADLTEALEQQTATSEVLQVISSSPGDLQPVFATMLEKAVRLCDATFGNIYRWDGELSNLVASHNTPPALVEARRRLRIHFVPKDIVGQAIANKKAIHIADLAQHHDYIDRSSPGAVAAVELGGVRTHVVVPMLKDDGLIGTFHLSRQEVRPFTDKQIEVVTNFAAQAVIAIENTRLLKEPRERTEEVEKLNQHLEQRVTDQVGEIERMRRLRRFLPPQVADLIVAGSEKQLESHRREITALFCDLRGFTGFTESADAEDVVALLRDYHAAIGKIIIKYNGTLERYAGDGVMVVFNDPVPVENPALQAVLMALELRKGIGALTETWIRLGHEIGWHRHSARLCDAGHHRFRGKVRLCRHRRRFQRGLPAVRRSQTRTNPHQRACVDESRGRRKGRASRRIRVERDQTATGGVQCGRCPDEELS
jgi:GAF domain-containing protein